MRSFDRQSGNDAMRVRIVKCMARLMERTPLDKLAVTDICRASGISRAMFYQCSQDKYAVVTWVLTEITRPTVRRIGISLGWREAHVRLNRAVQSMAGFLVPAAKSSDLNSLNGESIKLCQADFTRAALLRLKGAPVNPLLEFQIRITATTTTTATTDWMLRGMKESPEEFADLMVSVIPRELFKLLDIPTAEEREWNVFSEYDEVDMLAHASEA